MISLDLHRCRDPPPGAAATADWAASGVPSTPDAATGDLFVALKDVRDGHEFVAQALGQGGGGGTGVARARWRWSDAPLLIVPDVFLKDCEVLRPSARAIFGRRRRSSVSRLGRQDVHQGKCCAATLSGQGCQRQQQKPATQTTGACR